MEDVAALGSRGRLTASRAMTIDEDDETDEEENNPLEFTPSV